jgi:ubiquinone/menaquinone biosynthesis C-methylase UbiE
MIRYRYDPNAYEERYRRIYRAGATFWEKPVPTEALVEFIQEFNLPRGLKAIDFGCGEGRDSIFLAKMGFRVTGIDMAPSAVQRAKHWASKEGLEINFKVGDIINLPDEKDNCYDLAINIACLHMITDQKARNQHLREAHRILKKDGLYFSCNYGTDKPVTIEEFYRKKPKPGTLIPRKINVGGVEKEVLLPVIPVWPKTKEEYIEEFEKANFKIIKAYKRQTEPVGLCWVIIAQK